MNNTNEVLIDAHVHIHECYNLELFFNSAFKNFASNSLHDSFQAVICLTESENVDFYTELKIRAQKNENLGNLNILPTKSSNVIKITNNNNELFIVAGRQIVTKEKLEVLAIGMEGEHKDGKPIEQVITDVSNLNYIPIIPWGFGKWTGKRRKIVKKIISQNEFDTIYLGDNGNRPWFMKLDQIFISSENKKTVNMQGSDPLPFKREEQKPGSFGFIVNDILNEDNPFDSFYSIVTKSTNQFKPYGKTESAFHFFKNQFAMQIVKRNR